MTRANSIRGPGYGNVSNHDGDADEKKSEILLKSATKNRFGASERARTLGSGGLKASVKPSVVERFREKTMEMKARR